MVKGILKLKNPFAHRFFDKRPPQLTLELDGDWCKWAISRQGTGAGRISEMGAMPVALGTDQLREKIGAIIKKNRILPSDIQSFIPRHEVTARHLELPAVDANEIRKIIELQAVKQTPYAAEEIVFDYEVLEVFPEGYSSVILVIAHRDIVANYLKFFAQLGLAVPTLGVSTFGSAEWAAAGCDAKPDEVFIVLDVGHANTDFAVCKRGRVLFSQNLSSGQERFQNPPAEWEDKFSAEFSRALQIYRSEEIDKDPVLLVVEGASALHPEFEAKLRALSGVEVKRAPLDPAAAEMVGEVAAFRSCTALAGWASSSRAIPVNLIPQEVVIKASLLQKGRNLLVTGVLALSIFIVSLVTVAAKHYERISYLDWLKSQTSMTAAPAAEVRATAQKAESILRIAEIRNAFFTQTVEVSQLLPNQIYLTELQITKEGKLLMQGRAESMSHVLAFVEEMKKHEVFRQTETKGLTKRIVNNQEVVDFEINSAAPLNPGEARVLLQKYLGNSV